jgi:hypothetical protein
VKSERLNVEEKEVLQQKISEKGNQVKAKFAEFQRAKIHISRFYEGFAQRFVLIRTTTIREERGREDE